MSGQTNPVSAPSGSPVSAGTISAPASLPWQRALELCARLRPGKNFSGPAFQSQLTAIFADGKMTKSEFASLLGLDSVTNEFWALFAGGNDITSVDDFVDALENCKESLDITGHSLVTISHSRNIVPVSRRELGRIIQNMGLSQRDFENNPYLRTLLQRAKALGGDSDKTGFENLSQKTWELLAFGLFARFTEMIWKEVGYSDINKLNLSDPWVLERFEEIFKNYVKTGSLPTKEKLEEIIDFQEEVADFRNWAREKGITNRINIAGIKPKVIDNILRNYKEKGSDWVVGELNNPANRIEISAPESSLGAPDSSSAPTFSGPYSRYHYFPGLRISPPPA